MEVIEPHYGSTKEGKKRFEEKKREEERKRLEEIRKRQEEERKTFKRCAFYRRDIYK